MLFLYKLCVSVTELHEENLDSTELLLSFERRLLCSAPRATDCGGDLLHDEEIQVKANDPDSGEAVQVRVHHCGHLPRGCHPQRGRGQMASV